MAEADPGIFAGLAPLPERDVADPAALDAALRAADGPFVVRGLVADWPLVAAGRRGARAAREYLLRFRRDVPFTLSIGAPDSGGRLFYDAAMGMNFRTVQARIDDVFARMDASQDATADALPIYFGSINVQQFFPGLGDANQVSLGERAALASIWIGSATRVAAHNDQPDNLACVAVGRRRFTLFPPDQFANLYLGPLDNTPAGRAVSMVDFHTPDLAAHPRFADALAHARTVELAAGDAIHIPSGWWHHVEGLDPFNVLVNYWWRDQPGWLGQPQDALNHALLAIRDLPPAQKAYWRRQFDHYVFDGGEAVTGHIPPGARGVLDPLTPETAGRLRAFLLRQLSR